MPNSIKEITISQKGILYFILPYIKWGAPYEEVKKFEFSRKSTEDINPSYVFGKPGSFNTISPVFPKIQYDFTSNKLSKIVLAASEKKILEDAEFVKMITAEGFKASGKDYIKETETHIINAEVIVADKFEVVFTFTPKQPKPMPTWDKMPLGFTDGFGKGKAVVDAYEAKNGGKYNNKLSFHNDEYKYWYHRYDVKTPELLARAYYIMDNPAKGFVETAQYFLNKDKVFFEFNGELFITKEFRDLAKKEEFAYVGSDDDYHRFENKTKKLIFLAGWIKYDNFDQPVLDIHVYQMGVNPLSASEISKYKKENEPIIRMKSWESIISNNLRPIMYFD